MVGTQLKWLCVCLSNSSNWEIRKGIQRVFGCGLNLVGERRGEQVQVRVVRGVPGMCGGNGAQREVSGWEGSPSLEPLTSQAGRARWPTGWLTVAWGRGVCSHEGGGEVISLSEPWKHGEVAGSLGPG